MNHETAFFPINKQSKQKTSDITFIINIIS